MTVEFRKLHPLFVGEVVSPIELRTLDDEETLAELRAGMDEYAVLVFHGQAFSDEEQLAFAERLDGELNRNRVLANSRFDNGALVDISNLDENGEVMDSFARRRMYSLGNRLWHTDASFNNPRGRYSMLHARVVPEVGGDTEFADLRAAYDELPQDLKDDLDGLCAHHSVMHSRKTLGFEDFSQEEASRLEGAIHPLVHTIPGSGRKSLYIASHASQIIGWPVPDGRLMLLELRDHAVQAHLRYTHRWQVGDLVIWDNRCTMHRGLRYEDTRYKRDMRRVTTLDLPATGIEHQHAHEEAPPIAVETR